MIAIATRNLLHDKAKTAIALVGVIFSVVLVTCLCGLYVGSAQQASGIIDHAGADLWITARGTRTVDLSEPIRESLLYQTIATPGVLWAEPLLMQFSLWKLPDGRQEVANVVGVEPTTRLDLPWAMAQGRRDSIRHDAGVIVDERERHRFGTPTRPLVIGDRGEMLRRRVRVAGFSRGVGSFTMIPYVFTTHKRARQYTGVDAGFTKFIVVKAKTGTPLPELQQELQARMHDVDVFTSGEFARMSRHYWLFGTGVGTGLIFTALLSLGIGFVIVGQTIYTLTLDRLKEYAMLKAIGMENRDVGLIVVRQALIIGVIGFSIGAALVLPLSRVLPQWNLHVAVPFELFVLMALLTLGTCIFASIFSVVKVFHVPPASVFRG